jgi:hypothetical protein
MTGPQEDIEDGDTDEKAAEKKYGAA